MFVVFGACAQDKIWTSSFFFFFLKLISISIFLSLLLSFPFPSIVYRFVTQLIVFLSMTSGWLANFTGKGEI